MTTYCNCISWCFSVCLEFTINKTFFLWFWVVLIYISNRNCWRYSVYRPTPLPAIPSPQRCGGQIPGVCTKCNIIVLLQIPISNCPWFQPFPHWAQKRCVGDRYGTYGIFKIDILPPCAILVLSFGSCLWNVQMSWFTMLWGLWLIRTFWLYNEAHTCT